MRDSNEDSVIVFTARSPERIVREGGSKSWVLNPVRARQCKWLICTQNQHNPDHSFSDATEPHGTAFLLGKISGIKPSLEDDGAGRWLIAISGFARINYPNLWQGRRNPVGYARLADLGINLEGVKFKGINLEGVKFKSLFEIGDESTRSQPQSRSVDSSSAIREAKKALAAALGVKPEAIEITIRA
jgi:hypothetical protein